MIESALDRVRIVLVEPAGALNVGSIARVMKNMGLRQWVLVAPHCDPHCAEARQMAVHAGDVLAAVQIVPTLPEALQGCQRAIATTGRPRTRATTLEHPRSALPWLFGDSTQPTVGALIFGPEDRGLSNEELNHAQRFVSIPANPAYPSLNLAQAVAICCYELACFEQAQIVLDDSQPTIAPLITPEPSLQPPAPLELQEAYYQHLEAVLLHIGYLQPHTAASRMSKVRRLLSRSLPSSPEIALLRGMLRQVEWALQNVEKLAGKGRSEDRLSEDEFSEERLSEE